MSTLTENHQKMQAFWNSYKFLRLSSLLKFKGSDILQGLNVEDGRPLTVHTRPFTDTLDKHIFGYKDVPLTQFAILSMIDAVCELHRHGIIHRDIKPENVVILDDGHCEVFLRNFDKASSAEDMGASEKGPSSFYRKASNNWHRGSANHDVYSLATILLAWRVGFTVVRGASRNQAAFEAVARNTARDPSLPAGLAKIIERAILPSGELCSAQELAVLAK